MSLNISFDYGFEKLNFLTFMFFILIQSIVLVCSILPVTNAKCESVYCYCTEGGGAMCRDPPQPENAVCNTEIVSYIKLV